MTRKPLFAAAALLLAPAAHAADPAHPTDDAALTALCGAPAKDGACTLEGKRLRPWLAFESQVGDDRWYTAVAIAEDAKTKDFAAPGDKLSLAQVTYRRSGGAWQQLARQVDFGTVYSSGPAGNPAMPDKGAIHRQILRDGVLVGYPTTASVNQGIAVKAYALFRSAPDRSGRWTFGGELIAGSENGAGCEPEEAGSCYAYSGEPVATGRLTSGGWPEIRVAPSGTLPGDDGKARPATPADAVLWRYNPATREYDNAK